jgi:hypothetical protein
MLDLMPSHWNYMDGILVGSIIVLFIGYWIIVCANKPRSKREDKECRGAASSGAKRGGRG